jgi:hypothetical protein
MRDIKDGRKMIASYRELQETAKKRCFLATTRWMFVGGSYDAL